MALLYSLMRPRQVLSVLAGLLVLLALTPVVYADDLEQKIVRIPVEIAGRSFRLQALVVQPEGKGPFPVALLTHGSPALKSTADNFNIQANFSNWAVNLAARGYLVVGIARRGYGLSDGDAAKAGGDCENPVPERRMQIDADDLAAALKTISTWPEADMEHVIAIGQSLGGAAVLALASRPEVHLAAVFSVSGGIYHREGEPQPFRVFDGHCVNFRNALVSAVGTLAKGWKAPQLWFYSENDPWFRPDLARDMREAALEAKADVRLDVLPPVAIDGHALFFDPAGQAQIFPLLDDFLRSHGLPTWPLNVEEKVAAGLSEMQKDDLHRYLLEANAQKALSIAEDGTGHLHWASNVLVLDHAERRTIATCEKEEKKRCRLLMANYEVLTR